MREDFEEIWYGGPCWVSWKMWMPQLVVGTRVNILMAVNFRPLHTIMGKWICKKKITS